MGLERVLESPRVFFFEVLACFLSDFGCVWTLLHVFGMLLLLGASEALWCFPLLTHAFTDVALLSPFFSIAFHRIPEHSLVFTCVEAS